MQPTIRQETPNNYAAVHELNKLAFKQDNEAKLVDALRKNSSVFIPELSLVATIDNKVVGHILFTKIRIKNADNEFESLSLAPMAVSPELQQQGIGAQLIRSGLKRAKELGYKSVIVLGHEGYYPKFGFVPAERWGIKPPFDVPANVFMGIELVENGLNGISGMVVYPEEFGIV